MGDAELADALTMAGLEIDAVSDRYADLETVICGCITQINPHPDADRLRVCRVDIGKSDLSIVCGATNIEPDMMVPCALPGTVFPDGRRLENGRIRGQKSEGMLCSEAELGLGPDSAGIMILDASIAPGTRLAAALGLSDTVFDVDLTPNRPDCLCILGIAREIAVLQNSTVNYPEVNIDSEDGAISEVTSVTIEDSDLCPRYAAQILIDISVGPSPFWLQDRLLSVGLRPINNIVDITNFVMMETGQPLHAFDFDLLAEHRIVVRAAQKDETFITLDQKEHRLPHRTLMICDGEKPVAIAGVMGGLNSEINPKTTKVLIESACFNPASIRKTAKSLGLGTDASHRFERGVDPEGTVNALCRAADLMQKTAGGRRIDGLIDAHPMPAPEKTIALGIKETNCLLGTNLDQATMKKLLESIAFSAQKLDENTLQVIPPSFRVDVSRPEDLMEEIARLSGYNNIPTTFPLIPANTTPFAKELESRDVIKQMMVGFGFSEAINYSFVNASSCDQLRLTPDDPRREMVPILNPLSEDQAVMRTSMLPGLLNTIQYNVAREIKTARIFEIGKVFLNMGKDDPPEEVEMLAGIWTGKKTAASWNTKDINCDFYDIKGVVEALFRGLKIDDVTFTALAPESCVYSKPGFSAAISAGDTRLGLIGEVHPLVINNFNIKQTAFIFELNLSDLMAFLPEDKKSTPLPRFPSISRDITIIVDGDIEANTILAAIKNINENLVENILLFDIYEGDPIPNGKKSLSLRIIYRSRDETLEDDFVNEIHATLTNRLVGQFNATLPV